jgi:hypothetical protein
MEEVEALRSQYPGETTEQLLARALQEIANMRAKPDQPVIQPIVQPAVPPQGTPPRYAEEKKTAVLPKPPVFEGNRDEYTDWKNKMKAKLRRDGHIIGYGDQERVDYVCAFLKGEAAKYVQHYTKQMGQDILVEGVWEYLDRRYEDTHRQQRARAEHDKFKQGNKPFPEFIAELDRLQSEAGIDIWENEVKISILRNKLSGELDQLSVANVNLSTTDYYAVVRYFHQLHNNLVAAKDRGSYRYDVHGNRARDKNTMKDPVAPPPVVQHVAVTTGLAQKDQNEMDWTSTNKSAFVDRKGKRSDNRPPASPISEAEFKLRMEKNACFNCGNVGHLSRSCYYSRPRRNIRVNKVLAEPPSIVIHEKEVKDVELPSYDEQLKE